MTDQRFTALLAFIQHARWFGGKGRDAQVSGVYRLGAVADRLDPHVVVDLVELVYADEPTQTELYQVPLALYREPEPRLEHAFVGWWEDPELGWVHAYDAVHDRDAMGQWLARFVRAGASPEQSGPLVFARLPGHALAEDVHSTLFSGEQSNSSVMFGEDSLLKLFRKVTPGANPDITIHDALTRAGSAHVTELYGWVEAPEGPLHLAMLQQFLRTATDGWQLALTSVRNLYAEADLHAREVGGDFAAEAARLGEAVAEVHATLADQFGIGTADMAVVAEQMTERLRVALEVVPQLESMADAVEATYARLTELGEQEVQRIHGDLHLGQTLRTVKGWKVVDFEGEPAKPQADRKFHPLARCRRDVAVLRLRPRGGHETSTVRTTTRRPSVVRAEECPRATATRSSAPMPAGRSRSPTRRCWRRTLPTRRCTRRSTRPATDPPGWRSLDALARLVG
ncbi:MAG: aminoglycoside phosphotransferase [Nocardioides sp.]